MGEPVSRMEAVLLGCGALVVLLACGGGYGPRVKVAAYEPAALNDYDSQTLCESQWGMKQQRVRASDAQDVGKLAMLDRGIANIDRVLERRRHACKFGE